MSIGQIVVEFLIVAFLGWCGWLVFLLFCRIFLGIQRTPKSDDMESDANTDWYFETQNNHMPSGNPHRLKGEERAEAIRALEEHRERQDAIDAKAMKRSLAAREQRNKEELHSFGCGCLLTPVVIGVMVFGLWFSSTYPGWDDVVQLIGR